MSIRIGSHRIGSEAIAGTWTYGYPQAVITSPGDQFATSPLTLVWTYWSPAAYVQQKFRVSFLNQDATVLLYATEETSAASTFEIPYGISNYSTYTVRLEVYDGFNWSALVELITTYTGGDVVPDVEPTVGSVYEVGINGAGYMLRDHPDRERKYGRRMASIETPRLATGSTPFSEGFDRYTMIGQVDWSSGAGQRFRDRAQSDTAAFFTSFGVDPFDIGELKLLPSTALEAASAYTSLLAAVAGGDLYVATAASQLTKYTTGADTAFTVTGAGTVLDITSDGTNWYVCNGSNSYRNSAAVDPAGAWSTLDAKVIEWCGDRIVIAYPSSGSAPNVVAVLDDAGAEVGGTQKWTLPVGTTVSSITSGNGYIWWTAQRGSSSFIYGWNIGSTDSYFTALDLPVGSVAESIQYYQGIVYVQTTNDDSTTTILRGAVTSDGLLVPAVLLQLAQASTVPMPFAGYGDRVLFGWTSMAGGSGVGIVNLATGGYATGFSNPAASAGVVRSVVVWNGRAAFTVDGYGIVNEDTDVVSTGELDSSIADLGTGLRKRFDSLILTTDPLPVGSSVAVEATFDGGLSYVALGSSSVAGATTMTFPLGLQADSIGLRITLSASGASPVVRTLSTKAHPIGLADKLLVLPINCGDSVAGLNGQPLRDNGKHAGAARARLLESLMQRIVYVQDIDWKQTQVMVAYEVAAVDVESVSVFDKATNTQGHDMTAVVTLRGQL